MYCPYCDTELEWTDYFGKYQNGAIDKRGDIYKCPNEECESMVFNYFFWDTINNDTLHEGYPC